VTENQTPVLSSRLDRLADEMTPPLDVVATVRTAREAHRRRRRGRIALVAVATATAAVVAGTTVGLDLLSSSAPGRDEAAPAPSTASGTPIPPEEGRLETLAEDLRVALQARIEALALGAPPVADTCPERAPTLNSAFGAVLAEHSSGAAAGDCVWRTPNGDVQITLGFMAGGTVDQIHADVDAEVARSGCLPTALPGSLTFTALALCEEDGATGWHLRVMDTTGDGFWLLNVTLDDQRAEDPATTVAAVLDAADTDLSAGADPSTDADPSVEDAPPADSPQAELDEVAGLFTEQLVLTAPDQFQGCPPDPGPIGAIMRIPMWEMGGSMPGQDGCRYQSDSSADAPLAGMIVVRFDLHDWMSLDDVRGEVSSRVENGYCLAVDLPAVHPDAILERCPDAGMTKWLLHVPDSRGSGMWVVAMFVGDDSPQTDGARRLPAIAELATRTLW
jgi:hypothetical protein